MKTTKWTWAALGTALGLVLASGNAYAAAADAKKTTVEKPQPAKAFEPKAAVSKQSHVNVRGRVGMIGEVVTRLDKNQQVMILEEITLKKPKVDEPAKWYRIALPTNTVVWVNAMFVDKTNKTVIPRKLNLRGGPGENYSVIGTMAKGDTVTVVGEKSGWMKIEPPAGAFGYVAAHLLSTDVPTPPVAIASVTKDATKPAVEATPVVAPVVKTNEPAPVVAVATVENTATIPKATDVTPAPVAPVTPVVTAPPTNEVVATTPPAPLMDTNTTNTVTGSVVPPPELFAKRIVTREGWLKSSVSIQAPSYFELRSVDNNRVIDYVWSSNTNLVLKAFKNRKVVVSGEELLDERWPNTPVVNVETIDIAP